MEELPNGFPGGNDWCDKKAMQNRSNFVIHDLPILRRTGSDCDDREAILRLVQAPPVLRAGLGIGGGIGLHRRHGVGSRKFIRQNGDDNAAVLGSSLGGCIVGKSSSSWANHTAARNKSSCPSFVAVTANFSASVNPTFPPWRKWKDVLRRFCRRKWPPASIARLPRPC